MDSDPNDPLREAAEAARADTDVRFPETTPENFEAARAYQTERDLHHRARLGVTDVDILAAEAREDAYTGSELRAAWRRVQAAERAALAPKGAADG